MCEVFFSYKDMSCGEVKKSSLSQLSLFISLLSMHEFVDKAILSNYFSKQLSFI